MEHKTKSRSAPVFALRLPHSIRTQAAEFAKGEGLSLNHFITIAVIERVVRMEAVEKRANRILSAQHFDSSL